MKTERDQIRYDYQQAQSELGRCEEEFECVRKMTETKHAQDQEHIRSLNKMIGEL